MIADSFEPRTLANMEVALERACAKIKHGRERYEVRKRIAKQILACAKTGEARLGVLTAAASAAAAQDTRSFR